jgi:hypothetical protein
VAKHDHAGSCFGARSEIGPGELDPVVGSEADRFSVSFERSDSEREEQRLLLEDPADDGYITDGDVKHQGNKEAERHEKHNEQEEDPRTEHL